MAESKQTPSSMETKDTSKPARKTAKNAAKSAKSKKGSQSNPLSDSHKALESSLQQLASAFGSKDRRAALDQVLVAWSKHAHATTDALNEDNADAEQQSALVEIEVGHDLMRLLLSNLSVGLEDDPLFTAVAGALQSVAKRVINLEKRKNVAASLGCASGSAGQVDISDQETSQSAPALDLRVLRARPIRQDFNEEKEYRSMNSDRMRDERGRFTDDDDDRRSGRSRDDDRRYSSNRPDDDDDRSYSSSRRRDGNDERGWHGDSSGHSEAARRGWETRRSEGRYDDEDDRSSYSSRRHREDDDDNDRSSGSRSRGGWFGDSEGHSRAARGQSSSGRGYSRDMHDDEDNYRRSRSQYSRDDDDRRMSSGTGRGQGGWFGDSEGHSEASRRGWENRRDDDDDDRRSRRR